MRKENAFEFTIDKECKHSRRCAATDEKCPVKTVYVNREFADGKDVLWITIETPS